jgi:hypothetical protein
MDVVLEARIRGAFTGWGKGKLFILDRGLHKKWRQVEDRYQFRQLYRPTAKLLQDGAKYYLEVQGMEDLVEVKRT